MSTLRRLLVLALLLVLPLQGYAAARMAVLGPQEPAHAMAMMGDGLPCDMAQMPAMHDTQHHDTAPANEHACVKCPLCALHAGVPLPQIFGMAEAPRHADPAGALLTPGTVYLDPPLTVPRGIAA